MLSVVIDRTLHSAALSMALYARVCIEVVHDACVVIACVPAGGRAIDDIDVCGGGGGDACVLCLCVPQTHR
jgi:ribulose kinase